MKRKSRNHTDAVYEYVLNTSLRKPAAMDALLEATEQTERPMMATSLEQCQFLAFLIKSMDAKRALEIGVFTGVGTLWMADAVGPGGTVVACDISEEYTSIGKPHWEAAGVSDRIDLRLAPAVKTLRGFEPSQPFDFCYIDADKETYDTYYELVLQLMRPGGVIAFDNMLLGGRVTDPEADSEAVVVVRALNAKLHTDERVDVSFLPIGDGLYLARKR